MNIRYIPGELYVCVKYLGSTKGAARPYTEGDVFRAVSTRVLEPIAGATEDNRVRGDCALWELYEENIDPEELLG